MFLLKVTLDDVLAVANSPYETQLAKYMSSYLRKIYDHVHDNRGRLAAMKDSDACTYKTVLDINKAVQVGTIHYPCLFYDLFLNWMKFFNRNNSSFEVHFLKPLSS